MTRKGREGLERLCLARVRGPLGCVDEPVVLDGGVEVGVELGGAVDDGIGVAGPQSLSAISRLLCSIRAAGGGLSQAGVGRQAPSR